MANKNIVQAIPLTDIASTTVSGTYSILNHGGLAAPCFLLRIINASNMDITLSYDGINDNEYIPANTSVPVYAQNGAQPANFVGNFPKGLVLWVKGTAGTGFVYLAGYTIA